MFQANGGVKVVVCRKVKGRTSGELEVRDGCIGTDGIEDASEGLGGERGYGEVDRSCKKGKQEGGRGGVVVTRRIRWWGRAGKGRREGMVGGWNEGRGHVERRAAAVKACDAYPREGELRMRRAVDVVRTRMLWMGGG